MSEIHPASDGHEEKKEESVTGTAAIVKQTTTGISYLFKEPLTVMMTPVPEQ